MRLILIIATLIALLSCVLPAGAARPTEQARLQQIVRHAFPDDQARALCISDHESDGERHHWTAAALNGVHVGLFQISWTWHHADGESFATFRAHESNPWVNAAHARRIYLDAKRRYGNGWIPWTTRRYCGA